MIHHFGPGRRRAGMAVAAVASLTVAGFAAGTSYASGTGSGGSAAAHRSPRASVGEGVRDSYVDVTDQGGSAVTRSLRTASRVARQPASKTFRASQPKGTVLDISGTTGTVRFLGNLNGYLTGPSHKSPRKIALRYVRHHHTALGLTVHDLTTFRLARDYKDLTGIHHLYFTQRIGHGKVARNGLTASVNRGGHLLTVGGMPISTSPAHKLPPASALTITTGAEALARTRGPVAPGADTADDTAQQVVFDTGDGLRPAWETVVTSSETPATTIIDAVTGEVLLRTPLTQYEHSTGRAYQFFPGSRRGGRQIKVDFTKKGWLGARARDLSGNNSHAFSDVNDNNKPDKSEEVRPLKGHSWGYRLKPFHLGFAKKFCGKPWPCSWNPNKAYSWRVNRAQNATQVFYFVNNWHDHLMNAPIGFTEAAGNFQLKNHGKHGKAGDPVATQTDDGANTGRKADGLKGLPDGSHIDNANMSTPPDGHRPTMQMYLQHQPHTAYPGGDPFSPTNVGDEADTVYHEYTHGLSNRLNVDVRGRSTLGGVQAGAMGEAWSDWYAMDYLVRKHLQRDRRHKADVRLFVYDGEGVNFDRTEPIDCKVRQKARLCNGGTSGHRGGYTYADYGNVVGGPEVHGDGEIWAQTLWDLRNKLGSKKSESLVTRAMELAPYNPSFLDMRNAILVADNSVFRGKHRHAIWKVFAHRGMGYLAGSLGGNDATPSASFAMPPAHLKLGKVAGTVTDPITHDPIVGVPVTLAFQGGGKTNPTDVTDGSGHYAIGGVPVGHYGKITVLGGGYEPSAKPVKVTSSGATVNLQTRRDWAASSGGASITSHTGPNYSGCGPSEVIDLSQATAWSTTSFDSGNGYVSRKIVIKLGDQVDVSNFAMDPSAGCGDGASASTAGYRLETSATTATGPWIVAATGTFDANANGKMNPIPPVAGASGVKYVRLSLTSNQTPSYASNCSGGGGAYSGCAFTDLSELEVYGTPTP
ncbi:M36 family metallopeptidase [Nocardioides sp.]|uniref:M36 family metallopeptidase n=1 Tax=Nocardioides sp. TaxID=35761 RepID=UPI002F42E91B